MHASLLLVLCCAAGLAAAADWSPKTLYKAVSKKTASPKYSFATKKKKTASPYNTLKKKSRFPSSLKTKPQSSKTKAKTVAPKLKLLLKHKKKKAGGTGGGGKFKGPDKSQGKSCSVNLNAGGGKSITDGDDLRVNNIPDFSQDGNSNDLRALATRNWQRFLAERDGFTGEPRSQQYYFVGTKKHQRALLKALKSKTLLSATRKFKLSVAKKKKGAEETTSLLEKKAPLVAKPQHGYLAQQQAAICRFSKWTKWGKCYRRRPLHAATLMHVINMNSSGRRRSLLWKKRFTSSAKKMTPGKKKAKKQNFGSATKSMVGKLKSNRGTVRSKLSHQRSKIMGIKTCKTAYREALKSARAKIAKADKKAHLVQSRSRKWKGAHCNKADQSAGEEIRPCASFCHLLFKDVSDGCVPKADDSNQFSSATTVISRNWSGRVGFCRFASWLGKCVADEHYMPAGTLEAKVRIARELDMKCVPSAISRVDSALSIGVSSAPNASGDLPAMGHEHDVKNLVFYDLPNIGRASTIGSIDTKKDLDRVSLREVGGYLSTTNLRVRNKSNKLKQFEASKTFLHGSSSNLGLSAAKQLTRLLVRDNIFLRGHISTLLKNKKKVTKLAVSGNQVTGHVPGDICQVGELAGSNGATVDISHQPLMGEAPTCLRSATQFSSFDVSHTNLEGSLADLPPSATIMASNTQLTGDVVDSVVENGTAKRTRAAVSSENLPSAHVKGALLGALSKMYERESELTSAGDARVGTAKREFEDRFGKDVLLAVAGGIPRSTLTRKEKHSKCYSQCRIDKTAGNPWPLCQTSQARKNDNIFKRTLSRAYKFIRVASKKGGMAAAAGATEDVEEEVGELLQDGERKFTHLRFSKGTTSSMEQCCLKSCAGVPPPQYSSTVTAPPGQELRKVAPPAEKEDLKGEDDYDYYYDDDEDYEYYSDDYYYDDEEEEDLEISERHAPTPQTTTVGLGVTNALHEIGIFNAPYAPAPVQSSLFWAGIRDNKLFTQVCQGPSNPWILWLYSSYVWPYMCPSPSVANKLSAISMGDWSCNYLNAQSTGGAVGIALPGNDGDLGDLHAHSVLSALHTPFVPDLAAYSPFLNRYLTMSTDERTSAGYSASDQVRVFVSSGGSREAAATTDLEFGASCIDKSLRIEIRCVSVTCQGDVGALVNTQYSLTAPLPCA